MEQLIYKAQGNCGFVRAARCPGASIQDVIDRLSAYEDTGLEPEEVSEYQRLCDSYVKAGLDAKFVQFCIDATQNGLSMDRIRELAQAEKDGRLVVLPCKVGDTVYVTYGEGYRACVVDCMYILANNRVQVRMRHSCTETLWLSDAFGKTVFLTREKAEAAMKKREEEDNEAN